MSTAQTRKPHYIRCPAGGILPTERDMDRILLPLFRYRFLRSSHLVALSGDSEQVILKRLRRLYDFSFVDRVRPPSQMYQGPGSQPKIYTLDAEGAKALARHQGIDRKTIAQRCHNVGDRNPQIDHALAIADFMVAMEVACRKSVGVRLIEQETIIKSAPHADKAGWRVAVSGSGKARTLGVIPDHLFALQLASRPRPRYLFLEADLGTMPVRRTNLQQNSIQKKMVFYSETYIQKLHQKLYGMPNFRVLVVTTTSERVQTMLHLIRTVEDGKKYPPGLFFFTDAASVAVHTQSQTILTMPWRVWRNGTEERTTLLD